MKFTEISHVQWKQIQQHLPPPARTGRPRADDRLTINAILFVLITGCRWIDLPARYGSKSSAHRRFQDWQKKWIWKNILSCTIKSAHKQNRLKLQKVLIDSITSKKGDIR
ncbi:MAG: transposase [Candidatus Nitrosotenuis sp.]